MKWRHKEEDHWTESPRAPLVGERKRGGQLGRRRSRRGSGKAKFNGGREREIAVQVL